jgi:hypothetical protein
VLCCLGRHTCSAEARTRVAMCRPLRRTGLCESLSLYGLGCGHVGRRCSPAPGTPLLICRRPLVSFLSRLCLCPALACAQVEEAQGGVREAGRLRDGRLHAPAAQRPGARAALACCAAARAGVISGVEACDAARHGTRLHEPARLRPGAGPQLQPRVQATHPHASSSAPAPSGNPQANHLPIACQPLPNHLLTAS